MADHTAHAVHTHSTARQARFARAAASERHKSSVHTTTDNKKKNPVRWPDTITVGEKPSIA